MAADREELEIGELLAHEGWMRRVAWKVLGEGSDVDDVVQEAWLAHLEKPGVVDADHARARLGAIVRNRAISLLRRRQRRREVEAARRDCIAKTEVEQTLAKVELYQALLRWILELEEPYRDILLLRYSKGLEPIVIARRLNLPDSTVRVRLKRGLARLRERFDRNFNEKDRVAFGLLLFGVEFGPRRIPYMAATSATLLTLGLIAALTIWLVDFRAPAVAPDLGSVPTLGGPSTVLQPNRATFAGASRDDQLAPAKNGTPGPVLRGLVRVRPESFVGRDFLLFPEPYLVAQAMETPLLLPLPLDPLAALDPSVGRTLRFNETYQVPVATSGRYQMRLAVPGVLGALQVWTGTDRPTTLDLHLISALEVSFIGSQLPTLAELRFPGPKGRESKRLRLQSGHLTEVGPFMPGLVLALGHPADEAWWETRIMTGAMELQLPELTAWRHLEVTAGLAKDLGSASWRSSVQPFSPKVTHSLRLATGLGFQVERPLVLGSCRYPVPAGCDLARSFLRVEAPGYTAQVFPLNEVPEEVRLQPQRRYEARLADAQGPVLADVDVIIADANGPRWRGRSDEEGAFTATEWSGFAPAELLDSAALTVFLRAPKEGLRARLEFPDGNLPAQLLIDQREASTLIVNDANQSPLAGATARIVPCLAEPVLSLLESEEQLANDQGAIRLPQLIGGPWLVAIDAPGFESQAIMLTEESAALLSITLLPIQAQPFSTLGYRFQDEHAAPLANVRVEVAMPEFGRPLVSLSAADGRVEFKSLTSDRHYEFRAMIDGRSPSLATPALHQPSAEALIVSMLRQKSLVLCQPDPGRAGLVIAAATEESKAGRILPLFDDGCASLTLEAQTLQLVRPGFSVARLSFDGLELPRPTTLRPGPILRLEGEISSVLKIRALALHDGPIVLTVPEPDLRRFDGELNAKTRELALTPGRYQLSYLLKTGTRLEAELDLAADARLEVTDSEILVIR